MQGDRSGAPGRPGGKQMTKLAGEPGEVPKLPGVEAVSSWWRAFGPAELAGDVSVRNLSPAANEYLLLVYGVRE